MQGFFWVYSNNGLFRFKKTSINSFMNYNLARTFRVIKLKFYRFKFLVYISLFPCPTPLVKVHYIVFTPFDWVLGIPIWMPPWSSKIQQYLFSSYYKDIGFLSLLFCYLLLPPSPPAPSCTHPSVGRQGGVRPGDTQVRDQPDGREADRTGM